MHFFFCTTTAWLDIKNQTAPWSVTLPRPRREGRLLDLQLAPPPSPSIRLIPRPPAAAPAAGGRGIDGSVYIGSVGVSCVAAGGVMAEEARPVKLLQVVVLPLGGVALRSSGVDPPPPSSPQLSGAARLGFPLTRFRGTADLDRERLEGAEAQRRDDDGDIRRRFFGIGDRRLPAGLGRLQIQGLWSSSSGAPPTASSSPAWLTCRRAELYFLFLSGPFCNLPL